ncbi:MAG: FliI/YscN family ATPase [Deltaproteobacteria bacterium]|nr:FliI/YscN family ATPase [Deltaproteobacteria bacterium]
MKKSINSILEKIESIDGITISGAVTGVSYPLIKGICDEAGLGEIVIITDGIREILGEVTGFSGETILVFPWDNIEGINSSWKLIPTGKKFTVKVSPNMTGRIFDGLGNPIDDKGDIDMGSQMAVDTQVISPLSRKRINEPLFTHIPAIDGLLTIGKGQRVGIFAGSGVGKSTLLGNLIRESASDINVVCLVGERGREVRDFIEDVLGEDGMARTVMVVSTSDTPSIIRWKAPLTATAIAEYFRRQGKDVLLLMDSLTRFARAGRELGLSMGEIPLRRGYPASVFAMMPKLLERAGVTSHGSITGIYTVLVEGGDMEEPVADEVRGILDGHIVMDRTLASEGLFPAIDISSSVSRIMNDIVTDEHKSISIEIRKRIANYYQNRDLVKVGAYVPGNDPDVDIALGTIKQIQAFVHNNESLDYESVIRKMREIVS